MTLPSRTDIINMALAHVGVKSILAEADPSTRAQTAGQFYDICKNALITFYPWRFAMTRRKLARDPQAPEFDWASRYLRPTEMARLVEVKDLDFDDWTVEGRWILTRHDGPLRIRFTRTDVPEGEFDPGFTEMLALKLAARLVSPVGKGGVTQQLRDINALYIQAKDEAELADAFEYPPERTNDRGPYPEVLD